MSRNPADYTEMQQALLPQGRAWSRDPSSALTALLAARSIGLAAVDASCDTLLAEADPRTTLQMLPDWERNFGLPDPAIGSPPTVAARQQALVAKMSFQGAKSRAWFIALAASLGFEATIEEFRPFRAGQGAAGDAITTDPWRYAWRMVVMTTPELTAGSFQGLSLQAQVRRFAPAETFVILDFVNPTASAFAYDFLGGP